MVKISDCSCECRDRGREQQIEERALSSVNKITSTDGQVYYPDGTGKVTIPLADASDIANARDVPQLKISVEENTAHLTTVDGVLDTHAREISATSAELTEMDAVVQALTRELPTEFTLYRPSDGKIQLQYETEDGGLINSNVLDMIIPESYNLVSGATNRSFKLQIGFSDGSSATTNDFVIPAGGGSSVTVTGVTLTKTGNSLKTSIILDDGSTIDSGTVQIVSSVSGAFSGGQLTITVNGVTSLPIAIDTGASYTAGTGIKISGGTISVDTSTVALKSDIADMQTKTEAAATYATKTQLQTLQSQVGDAISEVSYDDTNAVFTYKALDGQENTVELPTFTEYTQIYPDEWDTIGLTSGAIAMAAQGILLAWSDSYYRDIAYDTNRYMYVPATDDKTIHFNSNRELEVIGSSTPAKFNRQFFSFANPSDIYNKLADLELGTFVSINSMGRTSSSWSGTISGILISKILDRVFFVTVGCSIWNGSEVVPAGANNYNIPPEFSIDSSDLNINVQKGNSIQGLSLLWQESQGCNVTIFN